MGAPSISGKDCGSCLMVAVRVSCLVSEVTGSVFGEARLRFRGGDEGRGEEGGDVCLMRRRFGRGLRSTASECKEVVGRGVLDAWRLVKGITVRIKDRARP